MGVPMPVEYCTSVDTLSTVRAVPKSDSLQFTLAL
jgi:hypothetical protein